MLPACFRSVCKKNFPPRKVLGLISRNGSRHTVGESQFETQAFKLHKLEEGPSTHVTLTRDEALLMYTQMYTIRRIETSAGHLYKENMVRGFCHLYSGQEAVAVGFKQVLRPYDAVVTAYRAHGWTYIMGVQPFNILSELAGKRTGCTRSKGGSMHMSCENFYGGNGIVGAQVPLGAGIGLAAQYKGTDGVCVALYGDGASNQGQVFEAYNMAKLWNVPCIFVCENNGYEFQFGFREARSTENAIAEVTHFITQSFNDGYKSLAVFLDLSKAFDTVAYSILDKLENVGMGTSSVRAAASTDYYSRGDYIPGIWVDGMDVLAVRQAARLAVNHCSGGSGPIVIEAQTYRYSGHSVSETDISYRTCEEVQEVQQTRDPINSYKEKIITHNLVTAEEIQEIDSKISAKIDEATKKAKTEPEIGLDEIAADVYAHNLEGDVRGISIFQPLKHKRVGPAVNL